MGLLNRLRIFLVLASCCLLNPRSLEAGDTPRRIDRIEIVRKDIFDTTRVEDRHFLGAAINTLHILTREDVIRRELLFSEGDELDEELLGESARTLRGLGYLGDAMVTWRPSGDSAAIVTVTTQDRWSIDLLPSYKQEGNAQTQRYTARDDNFLGGGHSLSFSYSYRSYLPSPHGTEVALRERNLLGTRLRAGLRLLSGWEGSTSGIWFERPYYSDRSQWAGGILAEFGRRRITRYENGILQAEPERHSEMQRGWFSASLGSNYILRPIVAYTRVRSANTIPRVFDNLDMVSLSVTLLDRTYVLRSYLNGFGRTEDMPVGVGASATLGKNLPVQGLPAPGYYASLSLRQALLLGERSYLGWSTSVHSYWGGARSTESMLQVQLVHHTRLSDHQTLVAQGTGTVGLGWTAQRQLLLGSSTGLRGYAESTFDGDRRITYGLEHRFYTGLDIFFFRLGTVVFADGGSIWYGDGPPGRQHFSHAFGAGLRIENPKVQGAGLIRIEWAMNLDRRRGGQIILSSRVPFSAFLDLDSVGALWEPGAQ